MPFDWLEIKCSISRHHHIKPSTSAKSAANVSNTFACSTVTVAITRHTRSTSAPSATRVLTTHSIWNDMFELILVRFHPTLIKSTITRLWTKWTSTNCSLSRRETIQMRLLREILHPTLQSRVTPRQNPRCQMRHALQEAPRQDLRLWGVRLFHWWRSVSTYFFVILNHIWNFK